MAGLTIQHVRNKQRFVRKLRILSRKDFWDTSQWRGAGRGLEGAYTTTTSHENQHKKPVLFRDEKIKWLDFEHPSGKQP